MHLVGSTELSEALSRRDLGSVLRAFETLAVVTLTAPPARSRSISPSRFGSVMLRDGDVFVNLSGRVVRLAQAG